MTALRRILATPTTFLLGIGVAVGSGVFRSPQEVAGEFTSHAAILTVWVVAGLVSLMQGLVTAELATRFPTAGGEYVYLREAYGRSVACFFGWAYTIFVIGGGATGIAIPFGEFSCELLGVAPAGYARFFAAGAIVLVFVVNGLGLRTGAGFQNVLAAAKLLALISIIAVGLFLGTGGPAEAPATTLTASSINIAEDAAAVGWDSLPESPAPPVPKGLLAILTVALVSALWPYEGTTDAAKMAEEIRDVRRALPRAMIGSAATLIVVYTLYNYALLRLIGRDGLAESPFAPNGAIARALGSGGRTALLIVAMIACLGALSSTVLATIRVTFALARDGLAPRVLSRMSRAQAPVPALAVVGVFALFLALTRGFGDVMQIYFFASALLFGLCYASLIVFRLRPSAGEADHFRCPAGPVLAVLLMGVMAFIAYGTAAARPWSALAIVCVMVVLAIISPRMRSDRA
jgi:APA family basic amino acid/polyamine antiporter